MHKTISRDGNSLEDLPNIGKAIADDLRIIGIRTPRALRGRDPYALYERLNRAIGVRHDPCVLDTFIAAVHFVDGGPARPWWSYTTERKRRLAGRDGVPHDSPMCASDKHATTCRASRI